MNAARARLAERPLTPLPAGAFILRPWHPEDAEWYLNARDEVVFEWTTEPRDLTSEAIANAIARNNADPHFVGLAIARADGTLLGNISLVPRSDGWAEVMYWLAPEGRGLGAATAALGALTEWAFENSALEGVFLKIARRNAPSLAVAARCGFVEVGSDEQRRRLDRARPT